MTLSKPIGVFDSGIGGLTVYRALREALPHEDFIYLGDTARLPYGTKSKETVEHYTVGAARLLQKMGIKFLVVACNTASAHALGAVQREAPELPYYGVIAAGAEAAVKATRSGRIAVLATEGTVNSGAYADLICRLKPDVRVQMLACQMLVALAEEGWCEGVEAEAIVSRYLSNLEPGYDTLVLGCTHFPLLAPVICKFCPPEVSSRSLSKRFLVFSFFYTKQSVAVVAVGTLWKTRGIENGLAADAVKRFPQSSHRPWSMV